MPILESAGVRRIKVDGSYLPVRRLDELFGGEPRTANAAGRSDPARRRQRVALQVDAVVGQEEIVVKSLGDLLTGHPLFAGVTIRGNGELVLILDVPGLIEKRYRERGRRRLPRRRDAAPSASPAARARRRRRRTGADAGAQRRAQAPAARAVRRRLAVGAQGRREDPRARSASR